MELDDFEAKLSHLVERLVENIVRDAAPMPSGRSDRPGAALGGKLADEFVKKAKLFSVLVNPQAPPANKTKNPWDARFAVDCGACQEEVWLDFKALDQDAEDSNPDSGSVDKFCNFLAAGHFYFLFVRTFFRRNDREEVRFVRREGRWCHVFLLRDVPRNFGRRSTNQLQMNAYDPVRVRGRKEFVEDFFDVIKRDYGSQIALLQRKLAALDGRRTQVLRSVENSERRMTIAVESIVQDSKWIDAFGQ